MGIRWQILGAAAVAVFILFRNLPAALTFLWPGLLRARETDDDGSLDPEREPAMERVDKALRELGFGKIGAIEVPVNCHYKGRLLAHIVNDSAARVIIADGEFVARLAEVANEVSALSTVVV